jgi:superfamily II DNA/RNA helicase
VQEKTIPNILEGRDVLVSSETGSGKTGAFLIPIITKLEQNQDQTALVVAPTRELAKQIYTVANQMIGGGRNKPTALLIGGEDMFKQIKQLKFKPKLVVGTPGRINDHLRRKSLDIRKAHYLILDETDRMLDMGFGVQIDEILKSMQEERQTALFSATLPKAIVKLSEKYLKNPVHITIGNPNAVANKVTHTTVDTSDKFNALIDELRKTSGSVLIFVRTQRDTERLQKKLEEHSFDAEILHGGLRQGRRTRVMSSFREKKCSVLIATDVACRGLDVPHIEHVINYDLPDCPEDYIHRVGRTARGEKNGLAVSLISAKDKQKWNAIQKFLKGDEEGLVLGRSTKQRSNSSRSDRSSSRKSYKEDGMRGGDSRGDREGFGFNKKLRSSRSDRSSSRKSYKEDGMRNRGDKEEFGFNKRSSSSRSDRPAYGKSYKESERRGGDTGDDRKGFGFNRFAKSKSSRSDRPSYGKSYKDNETRGEGDKKGFSFNPFARKKSKPESSRFEKPSRERQYKKDETRSERFSKPRSKRDGSFKKGFKKS